MSLKYINESEYMNVVVGQSGGPTTVINSTLAGVYQAAIEAGADKVYGMENGVFGFMKEHLILLNDVLTDETQIELLKRTPACFLGSCRHKLKPYEKSVEEYEKIFSVLEKYEIDCFFYIGGNDSMDTVAKLSAYGEKIGSKIRFVGIPKTIDNDLAVTDHTPGYGSAAKFVATVVKEVACDSAIYDLTSLTIIEIMGRNAGWLTAAAALAKGKDCDGADLIFLPEVPFTMEGFYEKISKKLETKQNLIIVVSEGVKLPDGRYVCELSACGKGEDVFGHKQLTGTALFLANECANYFHIKTRAIELSTLQRCSAHIASLTDINEAFEVGAAAVKVAMEGKSGVATTLVRASNNPYRFETGVADINEIANKEKGLPVEWIDEEGTGLLAPYFEYALPLIAGELTHIYENGVPRFINKR